MYCQFCTRQSNTTICPPCARKKSATYFQLKNNGEFVDKGCDICGGGMSKRIYDFQRENRPQGTICSGCSKKADRKSLKELA